RRDRVRQPRSVHDAGRARDRAGGERTPARVPGRGLARYRHVHLARGPELRLAPAGPEPPDAGRRRTVSEPGHWFEREPLWFKRAIFYEIHLRGFFDGNDDGSGDFRGLIEKLDFLQWLGVDCLWLLPMYSSPLRDGGYDIADFFAIHPDYGDVE